MPENTGFEANSTSQSAKNSQHGLAGSGQPLGENLAAGLSKREGKVCAEASVKKSFGELVSDCTEGRRRAGNALPVGENSSLTGNVVPLGSGAVNLSSPQQKLQQKKVATPPFCFLNILKPRGVTSFDVIHTLRKRFNIKKIGHSGTLDPLADGVLQVAVGFATRLIEHLGSNKRYIARIKFGFTSETGDLEGVLTPAPAPNFTAEQLSRALNSLTGEIEQVPPVYSAIKVGGKKLCDIARKLKAAPGKETPENFMPAPPKRRVTVFSARLLRVVEFLESETGACSENAPQNELTTPGNSENPQPTSGDSATRAGVLGEPLGTVVHDKFLGESADAPQISEIEVEVYCSKGTYIRSFAVDLAAKLGTGAYLTGLTRTQAGNFHIDNAVAPDEVSLTKDAINPLYALVLPVYKLNEKEHACIQNGVAISANRLPSPQAPSSQGEENNQNEPSMPGTSENASPQTLQTLMLTYDGRLVSIGVLVDNMIRAKKVFH